MSAESPINKSPRAQFCPAGPIFFWRAFPTGARVFRSVHAFFKASGAIVFEPQLAQDLLPRRSRETHFGALRIFLQKNINKKKSTKKKSPIGADRASWVKGHRGRTTGHPWDSRAAPRNYIGPRGPYPSPRGIARGRLGGGDCCARGAWGFRARLG